MSVFIVGRPDKFAPVFNEMYFYTDSNNKNQPGFKYILDIYNSATNERMGRYRAYSRPGDGYGVFDINQLLSNRVTCEINQFNNGQFNGVKDYIAYDVKFGEEYITAWTSTNIIMVTIDNTNYVRIYNSSSIPHRFTYGDQIYVSGVTNTYFDPGNYYVIGIPNAFSITITAPWIDPALPGPFSLVATSNYTDGRARQFTGLTNVDDYVGFNGAVNHQALRTYTSVTYDMTAGATPAKFLTNMPNNYLVREENKMWLNYHSTDALISSYQFRLVTEFGEYQYVPTGASISSQAINVVGIGPKNITESEGTNWQAFNGQLPVFKNNCWEFDFVINNGAGFATLGNSANVNSFVAGNYTAQTANILYNGNVNATVTISQSSLIFPYLVDTNIPFSAFTSQKGTLTQIVNDYCFRIIENDNQSQISEERCFKVDRSYTRYGNKELYFIDKLGSLIPINFTLQSAENITIDRSEYKKILGNLSVPLGKWTFDSIDRGRKNINTTTKCVVKLISNFINNEQSAYYAEIFSSQQVFIMQDGYLWPVIVTDNNYNKLTKLNKKNIPFEITIEFANPDNVNTI